MVAQISRNISKMTQVTDEISTKKPDAASTKRADNSADTDPVSPSDLGRFGQMILGKGDQKKNVRMCLERMMEAWGVEYIKKLEKSKNGRKWAKHIKSAASGMPEGHRLGFYYCVGGKICECLDNDELSDDSSLV